MKYYKYSAHADKLYLFSRIIKKIYHNTIHTDSKHKAISGGFQCGCNVVKYNVGILMLG